MFLNYLKKTLFSGIKRGIFSRLFFFYCFWKFTSLFLFLVLLVVLSQQLQYLGDASSAGSGLANTTPDASSLLLTLQQMPEASAKLHSPGGSR